MTINALDVVSIEELRQHIEFDSDDRDALIARYAQGALDYCLTYCDEPRWKQPDDLPSQVVSAMLLFFCDAFEHAERRQRLSFMPTRGPMICYFR